MEHKKLSIRWRRITGLGGDGLGGDGLGGDGLGGDGLGGDGLGGDGLGGDGRRRILLLHRRQGSYGGWGFSFDLEKLMGRERRGFVRERE